MESILKKYDLTQGIVWKVMIIYTLPIFLGTLFQSFYVTVDAIIIGKFVGKGALAAIDSVHTIIKIPINFFSGLSSAAMIIISQYYGSKNEKMVSSASHTAILFSVVVGLIISIIGLVLSPFFIEFLKVPNDIKIDAQIYLYVYFSGMIFSMLYNMGAGVLRALGNSKEPFYFLVIANFLNLGLDLLFINIFKLGIFGAGIATVISQLVCSILVICALFRTSLPCKIHIKKLRFDKFHLKNIFKLGIPVGIQSIMYPLSNTIVQTSINLFGVNSIAAWAICGKLDFLIWYISDAFCISVSTFVAQNYGAKMYKRAKKGIYVGLIMCIISVAVVSMALYLWNIPLARLLVDDENVILITSNIMKFITPLYVIYVFCEILPGAIRGTGESFNSMVITLLGTCFSRVLWVLFIVPLYPSFYILLLCYPISWGITSLIFILYYFYRFSKL